MKYVFFLFMTMVSIKSYACSCAFPKNKWDNFDLVVLEGSYYVNGSVYNAVQDLKEPLSGLKGSSISVNIHPCASSAQMETLKNIYIELRFSSIESTKPACSCKKFKEHLTNSSTNRQQAG